MKNLAFVLMILGGFMLVGGIATALVTKTVKPIVIITITSSVGAFIVIISAIATLFKEIKSSETQASIRSTGESTNAEVIVLKEKNDSLLIQSKVQSDLLTSQSKQLTSQSEQLASQGDRLVSQEELIKILRQDNLDAIAKEEAAKEELLSIDRQKLNRTLNSMTALYATLMENPVQYRTTVQQHFNLRQITSI